ncbi:phage tail sheath family protein [Aureitalea sp. L0-47]|uniref:phage tail sheath family protein n=1 Tax=Aureitalea sp. L0-47 TaxID=2816962 RepID=UPI002237F96A|nr:phage tail sheath C-terminal domain-containing protein [Aureitalea sp. L0-47]MCW5519046.1 phage tail sheath family protein [Aureitalea sp. L0-47]
MSETYKTPGVYIRELDAFGNSVVPVPTAVPVFIGHTEKAEFEGKDLSNQPVKILSLKEYENYFGAHFPDTVFNIQLDTTAAEFTTSNGNMYTISAESARYRMPEAMRFFYMNGGGDCYVMSIGDFNTSFDKNKFTNAVDALEKEHEITLLLVPEAVELPGQDSYDVLNFMIQHCGETMDKFTILDIPRGYEELEPVPNCIDDFRDKVGAIIQNHNSYAAAYYPWLHTSIYQTKDVSYKNISEDFYDELADIIEEEITAGGASLNDSQLQFLSCFRNKGLSHNGQFTLEQADAALRNSSQDYKKILESIQKKLNLIPPSSAMAGIYTIVDNSDGVWKAPANVAVQSVISPAVKIGHDMQEDLNVPLDGKAVCAIRAFSGRGNMVWGARTLDGNSNDWRYVNVRRTLIFLEQSIKEAAKAYVFAPNDASTWVNVKSMISNFLTGIWRQGGLVGPKPEDAYFVHLGLGTTMTAEDILNGILNVTVGVALSHPAEFIIITFQQQMQTS